VALATRDVPAVGRGTSNEGRGGWQAAPKGWERGARLKQGAAGPPGEMGA